MATLRPLLRQSGFRIPSSAQPQPRLLPASPLRPFSTSPAAPQAFPFPNAKPSKPRPEPTASSTLPGLPTRAAAYNKLGVRIPDPHSRTKAAKETVRQHPSMAEFIKSERLAAKSVASQAVNNAGTTVAGTGARPAPPPVRAARFYQRLLAQDQKHDIRCVPQTGRTIHVYGRELEWALKKLDMESRKVKNKMHMQRFHERPGLRKKRLRSQRWIRRFKTGFVATVGRVQKLVQQGW